MTPKQLQDWRASWGLSQKELAKMLGVHWVSVSAWENGRTAIPKLLKLALVAVELELEKKPK